MAITKVTSGLISADAASVDLNIDAGTLYIDATNNRVGIGDTSPSYPLEVAGIVSATEYYISGTEVLDHDGNYTTLLDPTAHVGLFLGGTGDTGNYYDNNTHYFRTRGDANQVIIDSTKLNIVTGALQMNGQTVIDASRNFTGELGTFSNVLKVDAGHTTTRLNLVFDDRTGITEDGNLLAWVSEPNFTYTDGGIGANIHQDGQYYGRYVDDGWGVYARFRKSNGSFEVWNTQGTSGTAGGQGTLRMGLSASGTLETPTGGITAGGNITANGGTLKAASTGGGVLTLEDSGSHNFNLVCENGSNFLNIKEGSNVSILTIDGSNQRVGIGATNPQADFQVIGPAVASVPSAGSGAVGGAIFSADLNSYGMFVGSITNGNGYIQQQRTDSATYYNLLLQPNGGNVGINITNPLAPLHVDGNVYVDTGHTLFSDIVRPYSTFTMQLGGSGSDIAYFTGKVGIGTNDPTAKLHVDNGTNAGNFDAFRFTAGSLGNGNDVFGYFGKSTSNYEGLKLQYYYNAATSATYGVFGVTGVSNQLVLKGDGRVYMGGTAGSYGAKLTLFRDSYSLESRSTGTGSEGHIVFQNGNGAVGSIFTNGSGTSYNTSSDYRLKENVVDMEGALDRVAQLQPKRFNFIADADVTVDGFLAHEVSDIVPEAISGEKDAVDDEDNPIYQGIDQSKLVPLLVKAIQELKEENDNLKARIEVIENG